MPISHPFTGRRRGGARLLRGDRARPACDPTELRRPAEV